MKSIVCDMNEDYIQMIEKEWVLAELSFDLKFALHSSESTHDICSS